MCKVNKNIRSWVKYFQNSQLYIAEEIECKSYNMCKYLFSRKNVSLDYISTSIFKTKITFSICYLHI